MILEPVRLLADYLAASGAFAGSGYGVNTFLASVARDAGDAQPANVTVFDETRDSDVARGDMPTTLPAVCVTSKEIVNLDGEVATYIRDGVIEMAIRYVASKAATKTALQDASYTLRAVMKSLRQFNSTTRSRNSLDVYSCADLRIVSMWTPHETAIVTGAIIGRWQFRDNTP